MAAHGNRDLGQNWLRYWLVALQYQGIAWANIEFSSEKFGGIRLSAI